jgi:hypothetical protein
LASTTEPQKQSGCASVDGRSQGREQHAGDVSVLVALAAGEIGHVVEVREVLGELTIVFQDSLVHDRPDQMGASRDLWVLLKELFEIPDTRDFDVVERLSDDPLELLDPMLVHLCDDVLPAASHCDSAGSIVGEAKQHPAGNVKHEPSASFLTGKTLVQMLELVPQWPV